MPYISKLKDVNRTYADFKFEFKYTLAIGLLLIMKIEESMFYAQFNFVHKANSFVNKISR